MCILPSHLGFPVLFVLKPTFLCQKNTIPTSSKRIHSDAIIWQQCSENTLFTSKKLSVSRLYDYTTTLLASSFSSPFTGLGNPRTPKFYNAEPPRIYGHHGIITVGGSFTHGGRDQGETIFQYQHDLTKFDSGKVIIVRYKENMDPADHWALENKFLRSESFMPEYVFNQVLLPVLLPLKADVTCLTFSTVHGRPYFDLQETYSLYDQPFNIIPSNLDIPRIRISDLVAPETFSSSNVNMNVVQHKGDLYTFMHHGTCPPEGTTTHDDTLLREVIALSQISNPLVLQPSYLVTDDKPTGRHT